MSPVKMEYGWNFGISGLKTMMKSGLERIFLKFLHVQSLFRTYWVISSKGFQKYLCDVYSRLLGTPKLFRNFKNSYPLFNDIRSFFIFFNATKCSGFIARSPSSFLYILKASLAKSIALWYSWRSVKVKNVQKLSFD